MILALLMWSLTLYLAHSKGYSIIYWVFSFHVGWMCLIFIKPLAKYSDVEIDKRTKKVNYLGIAFSIAMVSTFLYAVFQDEILCHTVGTHCQFV